MYKRDLRSDIYDIENIENFYYGKNKVLYIIFAYGNNAATIERDIVTWGRRIVEKENLQNCLAG